MFSQILRLKRDQVGSYDIGLVDVLEHVAQETDSQEEYIKAPYLHTVINESSLLPHKDTYKGSLLPRINIV